MANINDVPDGKYADYYKQLKYIILDKETDWRDPVYFSDYLSLLFDWDKLAVVIHFLFGPRTNSGILIAFFLYLMFVLIFGIIAIVEIIIYSKKIGKGTFSVAHYLWSEIFKNNKKDIDQKDSQKKTKKGGSDNSNNVKKILSILRIIYSASKFIGFVSLFILLIILPFISILAWKKHLRQKHCYENPDDFEQCGMDGFYSLPYRKPGYGENEPTETDGE
jgi:uncharacterized membrane protein